LRIFESGEKKGGSGNPPDFETPCREAAAGKAWAASISCGGLALILHNRNLSQDSTPADPADSGCLSAVGLSSDLRALKANGGALRQNSKCRSVARCGAINHRPHCNSRSLESLQQRSHLGWPRGDREFPLGNRLATESRLQLQPACGLSAPSPPSQSESPRGVAGEEPLPIGSTFCQLQNQYLQYLRQQTDTSSSSSSAREPSSSSSSSSPLPPRCPTPPCSARCSPGTPAGRAAPSSASSAAKNGEPEAFSSGHTLKDGNGSVACPVLSRFTCPLCGATGGSAHTVKYCPLGTGHGCGRRKLTGHSAAAALSPTGANSAHGPEELRGRPDRHWLPTRLIAKRNSNCGSDAAFLTAVTSCELQSAKPTSRSGEVRSAAA
uniref:Nanos-type domain-containing protein n=1 Tax=Macrostomum lignano TaxID=282301 RepID=A0A1I8F7U6_9PLAT